MKVTGETFSFQKKEERSRRGKILNVSKLSCKRTVTGQNSGKLYTKKAPTGQFLIIRETLTDFTKKNHFPSNGESPF
jgi:hypothetical protein